MTRRDMVKALVAALPAGATLTTVSESARRGDVVTLVFQDDCTYAEMDQVAKCCKTIAEQTGVQFIFMRGDIRVTVARGER